MTIIIISGTGTDVGKTIATAAIAARLKAHSAVSVSVVKPLQTGEAEGCGDLSTVRTLSGVSDVHEYARYPQPLAPNLAAAEAGMDTLKLASVVDQIKAVDGPSRVVLVEGAGGLLVRLGAAWNVCNLANALSAPMVVVTTTGLGSLNAAELTVEAAYRRNVEVIGLIGGSLDADPDLATTLNLTELPVVTGVPLLGCLPAGAGRLSPAEFLTAVSELDLSHPAFSGI